MLPSSSAISASGFLIPSSVAGVFLISRRSLLKFCSISTLLGRIGSRVGLFEESCPSLITLFENLDSSWGQVHDTINLYCDIALEVIIGVLKNLHYFIASEQDWLLVTVKIRWKGFEITRILRLIAAFTGTLLRDGECSAITFENA